MSVWRNETTAARRKLLAAHNEQLRDEKWLNCEKTLFFIQVKSLETRLVASRGRKSPGNVPRLWVVALVCGAQRRRAQASGRRQLIRGCDKVEWGAKSARWRAHKSVRGFPWELNR